MPLFNKGGRSCQGRPKDGGELLTGKCGAEPTALGWATKRPGFQILLCNLEAVQPWGVSRPSFYTIHLLYQMKAFYTMHLLYQMEAFYTIHLLYQMKAFEIGSSQLLFLFQHI